VSDSDIVGRVRNGEAGAYRELVLRHQDVAVRTAHLITRSAAEAEEAVQEAFVKAFYGLNGFREDSSFRTWLLRIVANEARNRVRAAGRRAELVLRTRRERPAASTFPSAETSVLANEDRQELLRAVNRLSEEDRLVIACRYFLGLSQDETAEVLDCPRGTVKSRLSRALGRLRTHLSDSPPAVLLAADPSEVNHV
jgi:RNA polymerase sigma factor (sigma-70 family)